MAKDEILIVGAGPVGLTMACELVRHGAKVRIIDKNTIYTKDSRAVGIHARTLEVFEAMGVLPEFLKAGVKVTSVNIYSKNHRLVHAKYEGFDTPYCFILDLPQTDTERILINHLEKQGVNIERNTELNHLELKEDCVEVMIKANDRSLVPDEFSYVVGCDGAKSLCRHLTQISFPGSEYPSHWIVFDAKIDWPFDSQEMQLFLHKEGISAFFPLPEKRMRVTCEFKAELPPATDRLALSTLQKRVHPMITLEEPKGISPFIIHHRQVTTYQKERVFLAGDAAHLHSPAGGQGMNTGIQDAFNLAWKLALVMNNKAYKALLETYHMERHPIAKEVLKITDKLTKVMTMKCAPFSFLRDAIMSFMGSFDTLTSQLPKRLSQLYYIYEANDFLINQAKNHPPERIKVGGRAPDHILTLEGKETRLFDLFRGPYFTLLLFSGKKPTEQDLQSFSQFSHPQMKTFYIFQDGSDLKYSPEEGRCLLDHEPSCHTHYGISKTTAVLVRPDNVIGLIQEPPNHKNFKNYLSKVFI